MTDVREALSQLEAYATTTKDSVLSEALIVLLDAYKAMEPRPISECPKQLGEPAVLFNPDQYGTIAFVAEKQTIDGRWWDGDWDYELDPTHFIPLSALPAPKDSKA